MRGDDEWQAIEAKKAACEKARQAFAAAVRSHGEAAYSMPEARHLLDSFMDFMDSFDAWKDRNAIEVTYSERGAILGKTIQ